MADARPRLLRPPKRHQRITLPMDDEEKMWAIVYSLFTCKAVSVTYSAETSEYISVGGVNWDEIVYCFADAPAKLASLASVCALLEKQYIRQYANATKHILPGLTPEQRRNIWNEFTITTAEEVFNCFFLLLEEVPDIIKEDAHATIMASSSEKECAALFKTGKDKLDAVAKLPMIQARIEEFYEYNEEKFDAATIPYDEFHINFGHEISSTFLSA